MLYYIPEKKMYSSRKDLRDVIGIYEYKREFKRGNIIAINDSDFIKKVSATITDTEDKTNVHNYYDNKQRL